MRQFVSYAICGGCGVLTDLALYASLFSIGVHYQGANLAGYTAGTLVSFVLNRALTFKVRDRVAVRLASFVAVASTGYLLSLGLLWLLVERVGIDALPAKIATLGFVLLLQFSLNRTVTFKTASRQRQE